MNKVRYHILFWSLMYVFLNLLFGEKWESYVDALYFTAMLMPIAIATSYFFTYFLVPRYLITEQYIRFGIYTCYTIIISIFLSQIVVIISFAILANYTWSDMDPVITDVLQLDMVIYFIVFLFSIIHLLKSNLRDNLRIDQLSKKIDANKQKTITVRSNRQNTSIPIDDIQYIESLSDYVKIKTPNHTVITKEKISHLEKQLPDQFIRCHRSFLFNKKWMHSFGYDFIEVQSEKLPIGRKFRKKVMANVKEE